MVDPGSAPSQPGDGDIATPSASQRAFDTGVAHPARIYDYWLGGKDNYAADRAAAEQAIAVDPNVLIGVRANRAFLRRAVTYLAREAGVRQFLDIGTGLPTAGNTHEVAQGVAADCRVVYVDNDPIVLAHAHALLTGTAEGVTDYIEADVRDTTKILTEVAERLDLGQPVAVNALAILQYIPDSDGPHRIVAQLMDAMPSGSYLTISEMTRDIVTDLVSTVASKLNAKMGDTSMTLRTREEFTHYFDGLDLVDPGVVPLVAWRSEDGAPDGAGIPLYAGMARKP
ncbi:MAG: SAM-dependent methyltransferase [Kineosporiaceae bacterium]